MLSKLNDNNFNEDNINKIEYIIIEIFTEINYFLLNLNLKNENNINLIKEKVEFYNLVVNSNIPVAKIVFKETTKPVNLIYKYTVLQKIEGILNFYCLNIISLIIEKDEIKMLIEFLNITTNFYEDLKNYFKSNLLNTFLEEYLINEY